MVRDRPEPLPLFVIVAQVEEIARERRRVAQRRACARGTDVAPIAQIGRRRSCAWEALTIDGRDALTVRVPP
ncbi:MAG: hypothetical protein ACREA0_05315 [bacterium]